ncbi:hypothetical protein MMC25_007756 [Agyrium rufum]|nr:hypothetical protein [Agyrium rufum]
MCLETHFTTNSCQQHRPHGHSVKWSEKIKCHRKRLFASNNGIISKLKPALVVRDCTNAEVVVREAEGACSQCEDHVRATRRALNENTLQGLKTQLEVYQKREQMLARSVMHTFARVGLAATEEKQPKGDEKG